MPLTLAPVGEAFVIQRITGKDEIRQHLAELGFVIGTSVKVVNSISGNLIIQVKDCRVALNKDMASRIII